MKPLILHGVENPKVRNRIVGARGGVVTAVQEDLIGVESEQQVLIAAAGPALHRRPLTYNQSRRNINENMKISRVHTSRITQHNEQNVPVAISHRDIFSK